MKRNILIGFFCVFAIFMVILDMKTALQGASQALEMCIRTVIPSLFPFFFLCGCLVEVSGAFNFPFLDLIGKHLCIPKGSGNLLIAGAFGGYPVGAKCIYDAYQQNQLNKKDAERMLAFCNNAGPSFIFGMLSQLFAEPAAPLLIWIIQLLCAIFTAIVMPGVPDDNNITVLKHRSNGLGKIMKNATVAMCTVCGWIIMFRVALSILTQWIFWILPQKLVILLYGFLELSNGCLGLFSLNDPVFCFIAANVMCAFGGLCVLFQTSGVVPDLSIKYYLLGKLLQGVFSVLISVISIQLFFPGNNLPRSAAVCSAILLVILVASGKLFKK